MKWPLEPKDVTTRYITGRTLLCEGPCLFVSINVVGTDAMDEVEIYDGNSVSSPRIAVVRVPLDKESKLYAPPVPIYLSQGLYMTLDEPAGATVQFVKLQQGE